MFDVKLQDKFVLKGFDVVKEAGGVRTALVKEFKNIPATEALTLEFIAGDKELTASSAPILSALEVHEEAPSRTDNQIYSQRRSQLSSTMPSAHVRLVRAAENQLGFIPFFAKCSQFWTRRMVFVA